MATATPKAGVTHDITLTDPDSVETGFMLDAPLEPQSGQPLTSPRLLIARADALRPERVSGQSELSSVPTEQDLHWEIKSFHKGALSYRWSPAEDGRYNEADGVDCTAPGEFALNNKMGAPLGVLVFDPSFEDWTNSTTPAQWTVGSDNNLQNSSARTGDFALGINAAAVTVSTDALRQTLPGGGKFRGSATPKLTVSWWAKRPATATASIDFKVDVVVAGGSDAATTTVTQTLTTAKTTYEYKSGTISFTDAANITSIKVFLYVATGSGESATPFVIVDDFHIQYDSSIPGRNMLEYIDNLYGASDGATVKFNETTDTFEMVDHVSENLTTRLGISPADDRILVGYGTNAYARSADGATWAVETSQPPGPYAQVRGLVWSQKDSAPVDHSAVSSSNDVTTPDWTDFTGIGTQNRAITGLYAWNDVLVIGKEDGLWVYDRATNQFKDVTPEFQFQPHTENFSRGLAWNGWLWLNTRRGMYRYRDGAKQDVSALIAGPRLADFGGRVRAFAADSNRLYILMDTPSSDATADKTTWLLSLSEVEGDRGRETRVHTMHKLTIGDLYNAVVFDNGTDAHLYMAGRRFESGSSYAPVVHRMKVPERHENASRDVTPDFSTAVGSTVITQYWDGLFPDDTKVFTQLAVRTEGCDANKTVKVEFEVDEDASYTTLGTIAANGLTTLNFSTVALAKRSGKRIRFRFTLSTNSATLSPRVLMPMVLHTKWRPAKHKSYRFDVRLAINDRMLNHGVDPESPAQKLTKLNAYEAEKRWHVTLKEDEDNDGTITSHNLYVGDVQCQRV